MKLYQIIFFNLMFFQILKCNLIDKRNKYCDDQYYGELQNNHSYFKKRREFTQNYFQDKYEDIIKYWKDNDSQSLFKAFMPFGILSIIYILILLFILLIFIFYCIKKGQNDAVKSNKCKCLIYTTLIFIIVLFILTSLLIFISSSYLKGIYCSIFEVSGSLLYGSQEEGYFIGALTYQKLILGLNSDLNNIANSNSDFQNIIDQNFLGKSNQSISTLYDFYLNNLLIKTNNGNNQLQTPISILSQNELLNYTTESEFNILANVSNMLIVAAQEGLNYSQSEKEKYALSIGSKLQNFGSQQEEVANQLANDTQKMFELSTATSILALIFLLVILIIAFIITCKRFQHKEKYKKNMICLIIYQIFLIIFVILIFLMFIGITSIWGSCGLVKELNSGDLTFFEENNFQINDMLNEMFKSCFDEKDPNTIIDITTRSSPFAEKQFFLNANNILFGIDNYIKFIKKQDVNYNKGITNQIQYYNNHEVGIYIDQYQAQDQLQQLNKNVNCDNKCFIFNSENNSDSNSCNIIDGSTQYQSPNCVQNSEQFLNMIQNLNSYRNGQRSNADDLKNRLSEKSNSPQDLHNSLLNDLKQFEPQIDQLYDRLSQTKQFIQEEEIQIPLRQLMSCKSIKLLSLKYERKACFHYNLYMYIAMIFLFLISILLVLISFCMCVEIRRANDYNQQIHQQSEIVTKDGNLSFEIATDISNIIEDKERIPIF